MKDDQPFEISAFAQQQRDRIPQIASEIEGVVRTTDPIELLSHLTILYQTHADGARNDRDEKARWQAKIEWLAWLTFAREITAPERPAVIDGELLGHLEPLLDEYFQAMAFSLMGRDPSLDVEREQLRARIQNKALFVRGLGYGDEIKGLAVELYSPHDAWCLANLGLTVSEAFKVVGILGDTICLGEVRARAHHLESEIERDPNCALRYGDELPVVIRDALESGAIDRESGDFARTLSIVWLFFQAPDVLSVSEAELQNACEGQVDAARIPAFLALLSTPAGKIKGEPSAIDLNPLAFAPLVEWRGRYYPFSPPRLFEAVFYAFHARLFADKKYRVTYDDTRAAWLESAAVGAFRTLLQKSEAGRGLHYGPKKARLELDGLVLYDNKAILIECKSKSPTLAALSGDVPAILDDLAKAILQPFEQAKRARDFLRNTNVVEFVEKATGRTITVRSDEISDMYLVTLVGSGAWASIAANLPSLTPLGLFPGAVYPWALSLADLRVVIESLELPSQLFDYLRRRDAIQKDGRFFLHDEWDFLGVYLAGHLYPENPSFAQASGAHSITLDGFDDELQAHYFAKSTEQANIPPRPRRKIPPKLLALLRDVDRTPTGGRSDAIAAVLGWPDSGLTALEERLIAVRRKSLWDGRPHAVTVYAPNSSLGIALAYACQDASAVQQFIEHAISSGGAQTGIANWIGIGCNLGSADPPMIIMRTLK